MNRIEYRIKACAKGSRRVWVYETGRDCDGVTYANRPYKIAATVAAYEREIARIGRWADGPFSLHVIPAHAAKNMRSWSRDNILEAFEDGHAWSIR